MTDAAERREIVRRYRLLSRIVLGSAVVILAMGGRSTVAASASSVPQNGWEAVTIKPPVWAAPGSVKSTRRAPALPGIGGQK